MIEDKDYDVVLFGYSIWIDWWDWALPLHLCLEPQNEAVYIQCLFFNICIWRRTHGNGVNS